MPAARPFFTPVPESGMDARPSQRMEWNAKGTQAGRGGKAQISHVRASYAAHLLDLGQHTIAALE